MKLFLATLLFLPLCSLARAGNDGPSATPIFDPPALLAEAKESCVTKSFCGDYPEHGVRLMTDGNVRKFKTSRAGDTEYTDVKRLTNQELHRFLLLTIDLEAAPLVDLDEGKPLCVGEPTREVLLSLDGHLQPLYREAACHRFTMPNDQAKEIARYLKQWL